ncbi:MAG: YIP1 family protein, partial [Candidatus Obscuribacter sp.]|nr:YIP1 family protein [Candidatus Obscuribacter sp.]
APNPNQVQNPNPAQSQGQAPGVRPQQQQYQPTPRAVSTNYAGSDAGRAPNMAGQYESKDFVPKTPPVINTGQDPNKPWASSSEPQFELFAEEYEEAIRFAQKAREQNQSVAPAKPSVWQEKLAEAAAATEVPVPKVLPTVQPAATNQGAAGQPGSRQSALSDALDTVAQPQLSRGAAALRAAGLYNKGSTSREADEPIASSFKISKQDIFGLIAYNLLIAKTICTDPKGFFAKMPPVGPMAEPLIFLLVIELIASLARCVTSFSLKPLFADLIMSLISTILGAVIVSLAFDKLGGKGNFNSTLRVLCFSKAPILIAFLGIAQFQLGTIVALGYGTYLNFVGLSKTQRLDVKTTVSIIVVMGILGALFRGNVP